LEIHLPKDSIIVLSGIPGSGKSTFAKKYFKEEQILSSDYFRKVLGGVFNIKNNLVPNQNVSNKVFDLIENLLEERAKHGYLTVIDATNLEWSYIKQWKKIADKYKRNFFIFIFDVDVETALEWNKKRKEKVPEEIIKDFYNKYQKLLNHEKILELKKENRVFLINPKNEYKIIFTPISNYVLNLKKEKALIVGDLHGDLEALTKIIKIAEEKDAFLIFLGDVIDRGKDSLEVLLTIKKLVEEKKAILIMGNHEENLLKALNKEATKLSPSTSYTYNKLLELDKEEILKIKNFLLNLPKAVLLNNKYFISHALVDIDPYKDFTYQYSDFSLIRDFPYENEEDIVNNTPFILVHGHLNKTNKQKLDNIYNLTDLHDKENHYFCLFVKED
jgi:protein phosphatase